MSAPAQYDFISRTWCSADGEWWQAIDADEDWQEQYGVAPDEEDDDPNEPEFYK